MHRQEHHNRILAPYERITKNLRSRIESGEWLVGHTIPSRRELAKHYQVTLATVERAVSDLLADGTLRVDGKRGTLVGQTSTILETNTIPLEVSKFHDVLINSKSTKTATLGIIGAVDPPGVNTYNWENIVVNELEQAFRSLGGNTRFFNILKQSNWTVTSDVAAAELLDEGVDAIAVVELYGERSRLDQLVQVVDTSRVPVVYISHQAAMVPFYQVYYDSPHAAYQAARHLLRTGRHKLLFLAPYSCDWVEARIAQVRAAVKHAGLSANSITVYPAEENRLPFWDFVDRWGSGPDRYWDDRPGYLDAAQKAFRELGIFDLPIKTPSDQWGIIAANDDGAIETMNVATALGKTAGLDYAVIGFDDDPRSAGYGLTTMKPPLEALGLEAARLIHRVLRGDSGCTQMMLRSQLLGRASTGLFPSDK